MPRANKINNLLKVEYPTAKAGTIKYDNPRQNIDPSIITQDVTAKNIIFGPTTHIKFDGTTMDITSGVTIHDGNFGIEGKFSVTNGKSIKDVKTWVDGSANADADGADYFKMPLTGRNYTVDTIHHPTTGQMITLIGSGVTVTFNQTGNLILHATTVVLNSRDTLTLLFNGTAWVEVSYSNN
jgi:hypothetical protein